MERLTIKIAGGASVTIESNDVKDLVRGGAFWMELPKVCPTCGAELTLTYRTPQDFEYFGLKCAGTPSHEVNFGEYKAPRTGFFYKDDWHDAFGQGGEGGYGTDAFQGFPQNPIGQSTADMITTKQLGMIRAQGRELGLSSDDECNAMMRCTVDALSKGAASEFIKYLRDIGLGVYQSATPRGVAVPAPPAVQPVPVPVQTLPAPAPVVQPTQPVQVAGQTVQVPEGVSVGMPAPQVTSAPITPPAVVPAVAPQPAAPVTAPVTATVTPEGQIHAGVQHEAGCKCTLCDDIPF